MRVPGNTPAEWGRYFASQLDAVEAGSISLTQARINIGTAEWRERLAYRWPRLCGWLSPHAARDRLDPLAYHREIAERERRFQEAFDAIDWRSRPHA